MQFILYALNFFLILIEVICIAFLAGGFFERKRTGKQYLLITVIYVIIYNLLILLFDTHILPKILCSTVTSITWLYLTYNTTFFKSLFLSAFWLSILTIVDMLFIASASIVANNGTIPLLNDPYAYYLLSYCAKILELFIITIIRVWVRRRFHPHQNSTWLDWVRVLFFPVATLATEIILLSILFLEPYLAKELFICTFILLLADLMAIFILNHLEDQHQATLENAVLRQNLKLETEHIESLKDAYAEQRKQTHDFQNQLAVLHNLARHNATHEEFAQYLEQILALDFSPTFYVNTNRLVVDVVLSQKYSAAKNKGIKLRTALADLADFPLPDDALVVVLTNLIDNAIEACEDLPEERRYILLKMQSTPDSAVLYIENPTSHPVQIKNNHVLTTKKNPLAHGYGLKNVYTMLERHNAVHVINYDPVNSIFRFSAQIMN